MSAAESRRLKRVAPPAEYAPLAHCAADGADASDVPANAIVAAVPSRVQKERDEKPKVMVPGPRIQDEDSNSRFTANPFGEAPGYSSRAGSQVFIKETMRRGRHWYLRCVRRRLASRLVGPSRTIMPQIIELGARNFNYIIFDEITVSV